MKIEEKGLFTFYTILGILNIAGYYDPLINQIENGIKFGFIEERIARNIIVVDIDPKALIEKMLEQQPPAAPIKWMTEDEI